MNPWLDIAIVALAVAGALAYTVRWFRRARRGAQSGGCGTASSCHCPKSAVSTSLDAAKKRTSRP